MAFLKKICLWVKSNFSIWNLLKLSNIPKLAFIYACSILWVIVLSFDFSDNFWSKLLSGKNSERKIAIYSVRGRIGEETLYGRTLRAADKMKIDYTGVKFSESLSDFWFTRHFYCAATAIVNYLFKPQLNLSLTHHVKIIPRGFNITYLNMPTTSLYSSNGEFKASFIHLKLYDAYIDLYTLIHGSNPALDDAFKAHNLKDKKIIPAYLAHDQLPYSPVILKKALITGSLWGCGRGSLRVTRALKKLAADDLLVAYGLKGDLDFLGGAYRGTFDDIEGNTVINMEKKHKEYGIALVIHNLEHMLEGIPTNRIAEAAVGGMVAISDRSPFIEKFFGDNILYFNVFGSDEEIYREIKEHILWVLHNPEEATKKAKNAYEIYSENFTIEKQLENIFAVVK